jgi:hypothetical protein
MLINNRFVFIHHPKTGGHFVRQVLHHAAQQEIREFPLGRLRRASILPRRFRCEKANDYHGTCRDIPAEHRHKPILSAVRNPFDYYVSQYHFGWWAAHPEEYLDFEWVRKTFPTFPNLSFDEFLELSSRSSADFYGSGDGPEGQRLGSYSLSFIHTFFRNPREACRHIDDDYLLNRRWGRDMFPVHFLRTERLNEDLYLYLRSAGYPRRYLREVLQKPPVRPTTGIFELQPNDTYKSHYSQAAYDLIRQKERLLFAIFDHFDESRPYSKWLREEEPIVRFKIE